MLISDGNANGLRGSWRVAQALAWPNRLSSGCSLAGLPGAQWVPGCPARIGPPSPECPSERPCSPETDPVFHSGPRHGRVADRPARCVSWVKRLHGLSFAEPRTSGSGGCTSGGRWWGQGSRRVSSGAWESRGQAEMEL